MRILFLLLFPLVCFGSPQGVPAQSTATCGVVSSIFIASNPNRGYLLFQNQGSDTTGHCYFKAGATVVGTGGLIVNSGQNYETVEAFTKQAWYCRCDSAAQTIEVLQTNY